MNHLRFACNELSIHIACLFSGTLVHGSIPEYFVQCTAIPIPKGGRINPSDSVIIGESVFKFYIRQD